ncbi:MAG TPA: BON domain-containing protein [Alphaproteobacteria bacterium]|nr:BON domain-containing protein [Alphaproteobacteria bacterium]
MKSEEKLKEALVAQLNFWVGRSADNIQVTVDDGLVTLRGWVPYYEEKIRSVEMAQRTGGVKAVVDQIDVKLPEHRRRTDAQIAASAVNAIRWMVNGPKNSIKITVQDGKLIVGGAIEDRQQKEAIEFAVRHLPGITGITNLITVTQEPLQRDAEAAAKGVNDLKNRLEIAA